MQVVIPAEEISETSGLLDVLTAVFGTGVFTTVVGVGILYAFFAALIPWTIGANRAAAEAAEQGDLPPVFKKMSAKRRTPVGAAGFTALVSATITLVYGVLFSLTNGDIDALFWSLFAFSSIVFLLPYVAMSLAFLRLRAQDPDAHRPYRVPGGVVGAWTSVLLVVVLLIAAVFFFVWNPWAEFDATTTWLILGGLAATFVAQEILVRRSSHWKAAEHPELSAQVDLEGIAPDSPAGIEREYESHGGERS